MSQPMLPLVLAGLLGGAVGGGAVGLVMKPSGKAARTTASAESREAENAPAAAASGEAARIAALEREVAQLKKKSAAAQALAQYAKSISASEDGGTAVPFIHPEDPVFELSVRSVMDKVEQEKSDERQTRRTQLQQERVKRQTDQLAERLKLTPDQRSKVEKILLDRVERMRALRDPDAGAVPTTRNDWRERMRTMQKETDDKLAEVLSESQMKDYQDFREEEGGFGRGRRGR
ncbi:MAG: hypothetical protein R3B13_11335 [Polyangiaceae bacterium]